MASSLRGVPLPRHTRKLEADRDTDRERESERKRDEKKERTNEKEREWDRKRVRKKVDRSKGLTSLISRPRRRAHVRASSFQRVRRQRRRRWWRIIGTLVRRVIHYSLLLLLLLLLQSRTTVDAPGASPQQPRHEAHDWLVASERAPARGWLEVHRLVEEVRWGWKVEGESGERFGCRDACRRSREVTPEQARQGDAWLVVVLLATGLRGGYVVSVPVRHWWLDGRHVSLFFKRGVTIPRNQRVFELFFKPRYVFCILLSNFNISFY